MLIQVGLIANLYASRSQALVYVLTVARPLFILYIYCIYSHFFFVHGNRLPCVLTFSAFYIF